MSKVSSYPNDEHLSTKQLRKGLSDSIEELRASDKHLLKTIAVNNELKIEYAVLSERRRWMLEIDRMKEDSDRNAREVANLLTIHLDGKVQDAIRHERQRWMHLLETGRLGWMRRPHGRPQRRYRRRTDR